VGTPGTEGPGVRRAVVVDALAVGVATGVVAIARRAPFLVVVGLAAATAAAIRLVG
jgi:hypothetical protein